MTPLSIAFLWHMHQPLYRLRGERTCFMPWVRLHAIRSYYDLVRILDEFPEVRVTMNLVPTLLEQIRAYADGASDLFWETGARPAEELDETGMIFLLDHFFSAQKEQMIDALPRFAGLYERRQQARRLRGPGEAWKEFTAADFRDLQALFDLSWFGFRAREDFPEVRALARRGMAYTQENVREIHAIEKAILDRLPGLYRDAAERGQIEISTTPYAHPILPLLIDSESAREGMPQASLPPPFRAPEDARRQLEEAREAVAREFGARPRGIWPAEGSVSQAAVEMMARCGIAWAASDDGILAGSEREMPADPYRPWQAAVPEGDLVLLFRDQEISDRVGFSYSRLRPEAAAADFVSALQERVRPEGGPRLLLIALDGENPWENYPRAGGEFLRSLYGGLSRTPGVACRTVSEAIASCPERGRLRRVRAGSWIRADFSTWIGGPEKNRAWTTLGRVRADIGADLDREDLPAAARGAAWESLRAAEGSDWFWWLDGQFTSLYRVQFDQIFRGHLRQAYEALGRQAPDFLAWPIPSPSMRVEEAALAEPVDWLEPEIDGFETNFFEWRGAVRLDWARLEPAATMHRGRAPVASLWFGFSRNGDFLLRLDPDGRVEEPFARLGIDLSFHAGDRVRQVCVDLDARGDLRRVRRTTESDDAGAAGNDGLPSGSRAAARKILELSVPPEESGLAPGQRAGLLVRLRRPEGDLPLRGIDLKVPSAASRAERSAP